MLGGRLDIAPGDHLRRSQERIAASLNDVPRHGTLNLSRCVRSVSLPRPNWSRPLPQPLVIPSVMKLVTLTDVRTLIRHVPAERRERTTWTYVASQLAEAAAGAIDTAHVAVARRLVLMMEGVECRDDAPLCGKQRQVTEPVALIKPSNSDSGAEPAQGTAAAMSTLPDVFADIPFALRCGDAAKSIREFHTQKQNRQVSEVATEAGLRSSQA